MNDNYLKKRTPQERLIIAKTLLETVLDDMPFVEKAQLSEEGTTFDIPSAEPKTPSNGSITCVKSEKMHDRTTDGLIRRQDVLHELDGCDYELKDWQRWKLKTMVRDIPSAEKSQLSEEDATKDATSDLISKKEATTIPVMPKEHREYQTMNLDDAYEQGWFDCQKCIEEVPSAEPEPIRINLNEPIKVKLTDWGKGIYYHKNDRINQMYGREICKPSLPKEDENGYAEFQLWCFMELYGMHMGMTLPNVIEPIEIVYER